MHTNRVDQRYTPAVFQVNEQPEVSLAELIFYVIGLLLFIANFGLDIWAAYNQFVQDRILSGLLVLVFLVISSLIMNVFTCYIWYINWKDWISGRLLIIMSMIAFFFQAGPVVLYAQAIYFGCRLRWRSKGEGETQGNDRKLRFIENNVEMLRTYEAVLQAAPQVLIQGFLIFGALQRYHEDGYDFERVCLQLASVALSLLAIASSPVIMTRRKAREAERDITLFASFVQIVGLLFTIAARLVAFVFFINTFHFWIAAVLFIHYLIFVALFHFHCLNKNEGDKCKSIFVMSSMSLFSSAYLAHRGKSRQFTIAYIVELIENVTMLTFCWLLQPSLYTVHICVAFTVAFLVGTVFLLCYYSFYHLKPIFNCTRCNNSESALQKSQC